jgi:DNA-binding transcriptional MerR regulator
MMMPLLALRQTATLAGLSVHTLRYYERIGLLGLPARATKGHHRFATSDLTWLEFLSRLRATGMPIQQIRRFADLRRRGRGTVGLRRRLLEEHSRTVERKLKAVQENLRIVRQKIDYYQALEFKEGQ